MRLFFQLIENKLHTKLQKKKKRIKVVVPMRIYQSFLYSSTFFFETLKLSLNFIMRIIISHFLRKIKTKQRIINCIIIISRNVIKCLIIFYIFVIFSMINKLSITLLFLLTMLISSQTLFSTSASDKKNPAILLNKLITNLDCFHIDI